jgi:hypothetical protein
MKQQLISLLAFTISITCLQAMDVSLTTPKEKPGVSHVDTPAIIEAALSGSLSEETLRALLNMIKEEDSRRRSTGSTPNKGSSAISEIKGHHRHTLLDDSGEGALAEKASAIREAVRLSQSHSPRSSQVAEWFKEHASSAEKEDGEADSQNDERKPVQELIEPEVHDNETIVISEAEKEKRRLTDLHVAAWKGDLETAAALVLQQADLEAQSTDLDTPLHLATWNKHTHLAMLLIGCGASFLTGNKKGATPFHHAAYSGDTKIVELILSYDPPLNVATETGNTPLHCAAWHNQAEVARLLLAQGAPMAGNAKGDSPLAIAKSQGHAEVASVLEEAEITK